MNLKKRESNGNSKMKYYVALCGELALEEAIIRLETLINPVRS
jgi:hypothetical protein